MDLDRSIADAKTAIKDIREATETLEGVVLEDLVSAINEAATEIADYLLPDAEEAKDKIEELEGEIDGN